jgi:ATP-dependent helicase/DNAse subunit B
MNFKRLSASAIKTFYQCQFQFNLHYNLELPAEDNVHPLVNLGSALHKMSEMATLAHINKTGSIDPLSYKLDACKEFKVQAEHLPLLDELIGNLNTWGYYRNVSKTAGCEIEFEFTLSDGTPVKGFIDRLDLWDDTADIIDLKTQKKQFEPEELTNNWQAKIYNIAVRKKYPQVTGKVVVSFWVVRHQVQKVYLTAEDSERDLLQLVKVSQEIKACNDPKPCPTALCQWCGWKSHCPMAGANVKKRLQSKMKGVTVFK